MKKACTAALVTALLGVGAAAPAAEAHELRVGWVRAQAESKAINWYFGGNWDTYGVNNCSHWPKWNEHRASCDYWVDRTTYGDLHCGYTTCWSTDRTTTCYKRLIGFVRGWKAKLTTRSFGCEYSSDTDYY